MFKRLLLSSLLTASLSLPTAAHAKSYYDSPPGAPLKFSVGDPKCNGCPKGDKVALNPAVYEFLLSDRASFVRSHYAAMARYVAAGSLGEKQSLQQQQVGGDMGHIYEAQKAAIDGATGTDNVWAAISADADGTAFSRAVGRQAADAANAMMAKKGHAQFTWGARWKVGGDVPELPKTGMTMTIVVVDAAAKTASVHLWAHPGMIKTVNKPVAVYDLSGVAGAFDAAAALDYDAVKAGAKALDAPQKLEMDANGVIVGEE